MTHGKGPGDRILAEKRRAAARAADDREKRIFIGVAVGIFLAITSGWLVWEVYDLHEEHLAIQYIQGIQVAHGGPVQSDDEIRQSFRRLQDQTGVTPSEARAFTRAFQ
jgi:hypothetical protein